MGWLRIDLSGRRTPRRRAGDARTRRLELRQRLLSEEELAGAEALAIACELSELELREALESLQGLHDN